MNKTINDFNLYTRKYRGTLFADISGSKVLCLDNQIGQDKEDFISI